VIDTMAAAVRPGLFLALVVILGAACPPAASFAQPGQPARPHLVDLWQQADGLPQYYVFTPRPRGDPGEPRSRGGRGPRAGQAGRTADRPRDPRHDDGHLDAILAKVLARRR
jgi:hypothetical protein